MSLFLFRRRQKGQSSVEFVFAFAAFFILFFFLADIVKVGFNWMGMEYATNRGIRMAKLLPTQMRSEDKVDKIQQEVITSAAALGINLSAANLVITVNTGANTIAVETTQNIVLTPITGLIAIMGGSYDQNDHAIYALKVREAVRNESL